MSKKPKFRPEITRVKLNPEQAVLTCACYDVSRRMTQAGDPFYPGRHPACFTAGAFSMKSKDLYAARSVDNVSIS